ncbi:response regulator transcription factor [Kitasatospora acidiphila]|uniref:helix-turn-helix transcriptional regulator n=1 Tax=Kitasatospora acidiphila TaxID=2567942 RepID=UPI003C78EE78
MLSHELGHATDGEQAMSPLRAGTSASRGSSVLVEIQAADPISRAGLVHQLLQHPAIRLAAEHTPPPARAAAVAVVLVDVVDGPAVQAMRRLSQERAGRVVLVAGRLGEVGALDVVECGVAVVLWRRQADAEQLARGVLAAARGNRELPSDLLNQVIAEVGRVRRGGVADCPATDAPEQLTEREADILRMVADGLDTAQIAARMAYSERTIKNILAGLTSRFQLRNRAHAVAYALRAGHI